MFKNKTHKLILGTVQMGLNYGINNTGGQVSTKDSYAILEHAFNSGIKILDSAEAYGNAHKLIGAFHKKQPNNLFEVITKLPHNFDEDINDKVEVYLSDLQVNKLHALLFHSFSSYKENRSNFRELNNLKAKGKIKYIGVSVYTNEEIKAVLSNEAVDIIQLPFNLLDNNFLRGEVLQKAKAKGKIIHTRSAFLQGLFFKALNSENETVIKLNKELKQLHQIKLKSEVMMSQLALNYCLQQQTIDNVLIGVDSKSQLMENLSSLAPTINMKVMEEIDKIKIKNLNLLNPSLWT